MLEDLKRKLLTSRDRYILSNKDALPEFEPNYGAAAKKKSAAQIRKQNSALNDRDLMQNKESSDKQNSDK